MSQHLQMCSQQSQSMPMQVVTEMLHQLLEALQCPLVSHQFAS